MAASLRHYLVEGIVWSLLGFDLLGENPRPGLQWLDPAMVSLARRFLSGSIAFEEPFTQSFCVKG